MKELAASVHNREGFPDFSRSEAEVTRMVEVPSIEREKRRGRCPSTNTFPHHTERVGRQLCGPSVRAPPSFLVRRLSCWLTKVTAPYAKIHSSDFAARGEPDAIHRMVILLRASSARRVDEHDSHSRVDPPEQEHYHRGCWRASPEPRHYRWGRGHSAGEGHRGCRRQAHDGRYEGPHAVHP